MPKPLKKKRLSVYLDPEIMALLATYCRRRDQSLSLVAETAVASFLSPDSSERHEAAYLKRLDQIDRRLARLERDTEISIEALATYVRFFLTVTPPLPEPKHNAAFAQANDRYDAFVMALRQRIAQGKKLRHELPEDIPGTTSEQ